MKIRSFLLMCLLAIGGMLSFGELAQAERSTIQCVSEGSVAKCTSDSTFLSDCPTICTGYCVGMSSDDVVNDPSICVSCSAISKSVVLLPGGAALAGPVQGVITAKCVTGAAKAALAEVKEALCDEGPRGCCIETVADGQQGVLTATAGQASGDSSGTGIVKKEDCKEDGGVVYYADCFCQKGDTQVFTGAEQSLNACTQTCADLGATVVQTRGVGAAGRLASSSGGPSQSQLQFINAMCFTREECASPEYGGSSDAWVAASECTGGKGKCRAPEPVLTLSSPILGQTQVRGFRSFVELGFRFLLSIVVLTAAVAFIWGGFKYTIGSASGDISSAKSTMTNAVIGLILTFGAVTILNTVNPATTRYDRLDVFMINKSEFSRNEYCKDYTSGKAGKPVMFADAGTPPGSVLYDVAVFDKQIEKTLCGLEYYVDGFGGKTCKGVVCESKADICLQCKSGIPECFGNKEGSVCVPVALAGNITYADKVQPEAIYLVPFCNHMQVAADADQFVFTSHMGAEPVELDITDTGSKTISFRKNQDASIIQKFESGCADNGGLRGAVIGIVYRDGAILIDGRSDSLIVGKNQCNGNVQKFIGYFDGTGGGGWGDLTGAMYCGMKADYSQYFEGSGTFFTPDELKAAFGGTGESISCDTFMDDSNAPSDPMTKFYPQCDYKRVMGLRPGGDEVAMSR